MLDRAARVCYAREQYIGEWDVVSARQRWDNW